MLLRVWYQFNKIAHMNIKLSIILLLVIQSSCVSHSCPQVSVCITSLKNANPHIKTSEPLPTSIIFGSAKTKEELDDLSNIKSKDSTDISYIYPSTSKCIKVKYKKEHNYIQVYAVFNDNKHAESIYITKIPRGVPKRKIYVEIERNKLKGVFGYE